jgi:HEAT repeat protein
MPHTKEELIKLINLDEPDYAAIVAQLTADDVPLLVELTHDANMAIATKAVSCLGLLNSAKAVEGLRSASSHANPVMRIAAAHALRNAAAQPEAVQMIDKLLDDEDVGVRKFALKSVQHANIRSLKAKVEHLNRNESTELMKNLSSEVIQKMNN